MRSKGSRFLPLTRALIAGAAAGMYVTYRKDINAARRRVETGRQLIDGPHGLVEFAESGNGPAVLLIHGAGGGFDQGLQIGRSFLGEGYRIIAPSRFGYLGTPLPRDASPQAQADAHVRLLDELQLDRVPVGGVSAGAPSAMQLCLRHPDRCSALVLSVPMTWSPNSVRPNAPSRLFNIVLNAITKSDFIFWSATKVAHSTLLKTILGTPVENYKNATAEQRNEVDEILQLMLPISRRAKGIFNDALISSTLTRYPLEEIRVPTLLISAADCAYGTYANSMYSVDHIPHAKLIAFPHGGHLLVGHDDEVRWQITSFLRDVLEPEKRTAVAS